MGIGTEEQKMTQGFDEWYFKQNHLGIEPIDHARESYKAGAASRQAEIDELQKMIDDALRKIEEKQDDSWKKWKESADMMEQGASNAYEVAYWILKGESNE